MNDQPEWRTVKHLGGSIAGQIRVHQDGTTEAQLPGANSETKTFQSAREARHWLRNHSLHLNRPRRVLVGICHGTDLLSPLRGSRDVGHMTVEQRPASTFRFLFVLNKDGHDDSTGRDFDRWLDDLTIMATEAREQGGAAPEISVFERIYENGIYYQNRWTGLLGKDANDSPGRMDAGLFQFDLKAASFSRTWTKEEDMPPSGRWADRLPED